jgi:hypothetical protein
MWLTVRHKGTGKQADHALRGSVQQTTSWASKDRQHPTPSSKAGHTCKAVSTHYHAQMLTCRPKLSRAWSLGGCACRCCWAHAHNPSRSSDVPCAACTLLLFCSSWSSCPAWSRFKDALNVVNRTCGGPRGAITVQGMRSQTFLTAATNCQNPPSCKLHHLWVVQIC